jgi:hypothetical protein
MAASAHAARAADRTAWDCPGGRCPKISNQLLPGPAVKALQTMPPKRPCPFAFAMKHGKFPDAEPSPLHQRSEPVELTDSGNLWNAVPRRTCQYLDLEAAQVDSDTSEGSTGSSDGSLSDADFIDKDASRDSHTAEELQFLQRLFPKTFGCNNVPKLAPQSRYVLPQTAAPHCQNQQQQQPDLPDVSSDSGSSDSDDPVSRKARKLAIRMRALHDQQPRVMANGIVQFPVWKRGPVTSHPLTSGEKENVPPESAWEEVD